MDARVGFLLLCVLGASWACNARQLVTPDVHISYEEQEIDVQALKKVKVSRNENVCTLCEEYTSQALDYLAGNKTQTEIIDTLHESCSKLRSFQKECVTLVDYYAPLFFLEVSTIQPEDFCVKVNLCEQMTTSSPPLYQDSCGFCHQAIDEIQNKLKDPDTQLEILELLLKSCDAVEKPYVKKCKRMVFEYGPLLMTNAEKFLETTDICSTFHACVSPSASNKQDVPLRSDS